VKQLSTHIRQNTQLFLDIIRLCTNKIALKFTATTRLGRARININTKHNKYNRHATTNQIILSLVTEVNKKKYLPEDGQKLTETCRRILRLLKQYDHFNVLF
jgi:hypothetical protein